MANMGRELHKKNLQLEEANKTIRRLMNIDPLTKVANRRMLGEIAETAIDFARRHNESISVVMADIDHFKKFNDTYGHATGDAVLVAFSQMLVSCCRAEDTVSRYGGEEFLILLNGLPLHRAAEVAERFREGAMEINISGIQDKIRASFGVAELLPGETLEECVKRADIALYRAKESGRNRVEIY
jgi:diguanylate cyclase (GGDEF)-like protein